jgi:hypothetical protein
MNSKGPSNRPVLVYSIGELISMFGEPGAPITRRSIQVDKNWIDAYNVQIERTMRGKSIDELGPIEMRLVKMLLFKYFDSAYSYILKKHCS